MGCIGDDPRRAEIASTRAFFAPRAAGWEDRFPDDGPSYERAVDELKPPEGGRVLDAACGTGRALPALRAAVGPAGTVVGVDLTAEMLAEAGRRGRGSVAVLVLADAMKLPWPPVRLTPSSPQVCCRIWKIPWPAWRNSREYAGAAGAWHSSTPSGAPHSPVGTATSPTPRTSAPWLGSVTRSPAPAGAVTRSTMPTTATSFSHRA